MKQLIRNIKPVIGMVPGAVTSVVGDYVSLKDFHGCSIVIVVDNTSGTDDGAVTLLQAKTANAGSAKALEFDEMWANLDCETADALTKTDVVSDTFDASGVELCTMYVIEVNADQLDVDNAFCYINVNIATVTNGVGAIIYLMHTPRFIDDVTAHSVIA